MNSSLLVDVQNRLGWVTLLLTLAMLLSTIAPVLGGMQPSTNRSNAHPSNNSLVPSSHVSLARTPVPKSHGQPGVPTASELPAIGTQKERSSIPPYPIPTGTSGERETPHLAGPATSANPYYFQEGATFSQFDGSTVTFSGWYFNVTLVTSGYPVGYEFNGLSNTGDWYQVLVGDNWPGCAGFEMLYAYWNNTGKNSGGTWCDPSVTLSAGNNVALDMYVDTNVLSPTYSRVCLEVYDWTTGKANTNTDCFAQPDPGSTPASNYFVTLSSSANPNGFFSGPMTEVIDTAATSCITYGSMPTVSYQWASSKNGNLYVSKYIPWSDQFQQGGSLCYVYDSPAITINPNYHGSIYTQAASSYGPHWESSTNVSSIADVWNFVTDQTPVSPATTTLSGSRANADIGQNVVFTPNTTNGTSPYTYSWYLDNVFQTTTSGSWTLTVSVTGTHSVVAYTQSSGGNTYGPSSSASVAVWSDPTVGTPSASPGSGGVDVGQSVTFTSAVPTGGYGSYSYSWGGLPTGCTNSGTSKDVCTPTAGGTFSVAVTVTDSDGFPVVSPSLSYTVDPKLGVTLSTDKSVIDLGQSFNLTSTPSGGSGAYSYSYSGLPVGCASANTLTLLCKPTSKGVFNISVTVTDTNTAQVTSTPLITITVNPALVVSGFTASPNPIPDGGTTYLNVTVSGGTAPLTYTYSGLPSSCMTANSASITCTPTTAGVYLITVTVKDSLGMTVSSSAKLTVTGPTVSSFTVTPSPVNVGNPVTFSVSVSGGATPYTFAYAGLPPGCASTNVATFSCIPSSSGSFNVTVTVTDANGNKATKSTLLTVNSVSGPTITAFTASPNPVTVSTATTLSVTVSGGTTPYVYAYTGLPTGCTSSNTASLSCTPTVTGSFNVTVTVTDANSKTATKTTSLTVNPVSVPTITAFTASPNPVTVSTATTLSVTVSGGTTPYTYAYTGLPTGCTSSNTASLSCTPTVTGSFNVTVTVTDANSKTATKSVTLTVSAASAPVVTAFSASPNPVSVNSATTFSVTVSGGTVPYSYAYSGLPPGCTTTNTATLSCTPTVAGSYNVTVTVTDANSKSAGKTTTLVVNSVSAPTITGFSASSNPDLVYTPTTFAVSVSGGKSPYTYVYAGLPSGCASSNTANLSCTPTSTGVFNVSVTVTDSQSLTATSYTVLKVIPASPSISSFSVSPTTVSVGQSATFSATVTGGTPPYSYVYSGLPSGCTSSNKSTLSCTPSVSGNFTVTLSVTDSAGKIATPKSAVLQVTPSQGPTISAFTVTPNPVTVGSSVTFTVTAAGGSAPYTYSYVGLPNGCSSSSTSTLTCTPKTAGSYNVSVSVIDSKSLQVSDTINLTVKQAPGGPTVTSFLPTPNPVSVEQSVIFSVVVSGGTAPFSYSYSGLPPGCSSANTNTLTCTPSSPGNYTVSVLVSDKTGKTAAKSALLVVTGVVKPLSVTLTSNLTSMNVGSSVELSAIVSGGVGPFSFVWMVNGGNQSATQNSTWDDTITQVGAYNFTVWVRDAKGHVAASQVVAVEVTGLTQSAPQAFPWWILLVVIAAVAVGMVIYMRERRRKDAQMTHGARDGETGMMAEETYTGIMPAGALIDTPSSLEPQDTGVVEPFPAPYTLAPEPPVATAPEGETSGEIKTEVQPGFYDASGPAEVASTAPFSQEEPIVVPKEEIPDAEVVGPIATEMAPEPLPTPAGPPVDEADKPLTECPQCMGTLTPELYCLVCSVGWVREEKSSESTLTSPSIQDHGTASPPADSTAVSGILEPAHMKSHGVEDIEAELKEAERRRQEEAHRSGEELKGPSGDMGVAPIPGSEANPTGSSTTQGKNCFMCGGPLKDDYCAVCDMHWEGAGPS